jgi:hypothetical protein
MYKEFTYDSFGDLIKDYQDAYAECFHQLLTVNVGLPLSHNDYYGSAICWRCMKLKLFKHDWELMHAGMNAFVHDAAKLSVVYERSGKKQGC